MERFSELTAGRKPPSEVLLPLQISTSRWGLPAAHPSPCVFLTPGACLISRAAPRTLSFPGVFWAGRPRTFTPPTEGRPPTDSPPGARWPEGGTWAGIRRPGDPGWSWGCSGHVGSRRRPALLARPQDRTAMVRAPFCTCSRRPLRRGFPGGRAEASEGVSLDVEMGRGVSKFLGRLLLPGQLWPGCLRPGGTASEGCRHVLGGSRVWSTMDQVLPSPQGSHPAQVGGVRVGRGHASPAETVGLCDTWICSTEKAHPSLHHLYC